ncbi:hypothetical protein [Burkholderia ubonensis]|uniref:hypothetical protein n=1 Tax=Burkholderia ubonensis TaxID=101571 RepID=UPI0012F747DA|nr:hypothetical protein [Burkholderia ubonensis]
MIFTVDWGSEKRTAKGTGRSNGAPGRNAHEEHARYGLLPALIRDAFDITPPYVFILSPNGNVAIRSPAARQPGDREMAKGGSTARRPSRPAHRAVNTDSGSIPAAEQVEEKAIAGSAAIARPPASSQFKKRRRDTKLGDLRRVPIRQKRPKRIANSRRRVASKNPDQESTIPARLD